MKLAGPEIYYEFTDKKPPNPLLLDALEMNNFSHGARALDLGCGAGRDTAALIRAGFEVTAVDAEASSCERTANRPDTDGAHVVCSNFEDFDYGSYDLVNCEWSLPFVEDRDTLKDIVTKIKDSLNPGGTLIVNFFGVNDEWSQHEDMTFLTAEEAATLLDGSYPLTP